MFVAKPCMEFPTFHKSRVKSVTVGLYCPSLEAHQFSQFRSAKLHWPSIKLLSVTHSCSQWDTRRDLNQLHFFHAMWTFSSTIKVTEAALCGPLSAPTIQLSEYSQLWTRKLWFAMNDATLFRTYPVNSLFLDFLNGSDLEDHSGPSCQLLKTIT